MMFYKQIKQLEKIQLIPSLSIKPDSILDRLTIDMLSNENVKMVA